MSQLYYTRRQVLMLQVEISDMIRSVIRDFLTNTNELMGKTKTYKLVTIEATGESVDFDFVFKPNPLDELLVNNTSREVRDTEAYRKRPFATATTVLHGRPYAITFQQEDFASDVEETMKMPIIEQVGFHFLEHIVGGMASSWYHQELHKVIAQWNTESNFEAIKERFSGMIDATWNDTGYSVDVLVPYHSAEAELHVVKRNVSFNALPQHPGPNNKNVDICQRYIDLGIISLIALGYIEKDFSWTLN